MDHLLLLIIPERLSSAHWDSRDVIIGASPGVAHDAWELLGPAVHDWPPLFAHLRPPRLPGFWVLECGLTWEGAGKSSLGRDRRELVLVGEGVVWHPASFHVVVAATFSGKFGVAQPAPAAAPPTPNHHHTLYEVISGGRDGSRS